MPKLGKILKVPALFRTELSQDSFWLWNVRQIRKPIFLVIIVSKIYFEYSNKRLIKYQFAICNLNLLIDSSSTRQFSNSFTLYKQFFPVSFCYFWFSCYKYSEEFGRRILVSRRIWPKFSGENFDRWISEAGRQWTGISEGRWIYFSSFRD